MDALQAFSKLYKIYRLVSDIQFQSRRDRLIHLMEEKAKTGQKKSWANKEMIEINAFAFEYLHAFKEEREQIINSLKKITKEEFENRIDRALILMFVEEDVAKVLIQDEKKALATNRIALAFLSNFQEEKLTMEDFHNSFTFLEVLNYPYINDEEFFTVFKKSSFS